MSPVEMAILASFHMVRMVRDSEIADLALSESLNAKTIKNHIYEGPPGLWELWATA